MKSQKNEFPLENILRDRLNILYQKKSREELLQILIEKEISILKIQKDTENLKFQNFQLTQKLLDIKLQSNSSLKNINFSQKKPMPINSNFNTNIQKNSNILNDNKNSSNIKVFNEFKTNFNNDHLCLPNESFVKNELSILDDNDLKFNFENDALFNFKFNKDKNKNSKNYEEIVFICLNEVKKLLKKFLVDYDLFNDINNKVDVESNGNLLPYEIQMMEIKKYIDNLYSIGGLFQSYFIQYSNQLLFLIQNNIYDILNQKMMELQENFNSFRNIFIEK